MCEHTFGAEIVTRETNFDGKKRWQHVRNGRGELQEELQDRASWLREEIGQGAFCECGAWLGNLGLEPIPDLYVTHMVAIFREVWRVLRDDGTLWLNLGDCYATGAGAVGDSPGGGKQGERWKSMNPSLGGHRGSRPGSPMHSNRLQVSDVNTGVPTFQPNRMPLPGLKPKDLIGMPWRVAFALQADGWYLRSDIIWSKPNPMPESVKDRPTRAHEYLFLMAKSERYYYDWEAIREPVGRARQGGLSSWDQSVGNGNHGGVPQGRYSSGNKERNYETPTRLNDHKASGMPWQDDGGGRNKRSVWTVGTQPFPEAHFATFPTALIEPCILAGSRPGDIVFDPFIGSGTTAMVAIKHHRKWIGLELSDEYIGIARKRIGRGVQAVLG